jgi:hypothetical protein
MPIDNGRHSGIIVIQIITKIAFYAQHYKYFVARINGKVNKKGCQRWGVFFDQRIYQASGQALVNQAIKPGTAG